MPTLEEHPRLDRQEAARKRAGQREQILAMLQAAGPRGCTSEELNRVAFRYASVIYRLRHLDGHQIETIGRQETELARYVLAMKTEDNGQIKLF